MLEREHLKCSYDLPPMHIMHNQDASHFYSAFS
jgi:hypothetical protein